MKIFELGKKDQNAELQKQIDALKKDQEARKAKDAQIKKDAKKGLDGAPSVDQLKKQQAQPLMKKADDAMRGSFLQKSIDTLQKATGRKGPQQTKIDKKYKIVKTPVKKTVTVDDPKAADGAATPGDTGTPQGDTGTPTPTPTPEPKSEFPVSKQGIQLKPGDVVDYTNQKGQQKRATVNKMLRTTDKQGDLQIQLKLKGATYAIDRDNITAANGEPWEFDPATERGKVKESILKEGGNVFKDADKNPLTTRIATAKVRPTVDAIEKITGLTFVDEDLLGTTGKKIKADGTFDQNSSGDLDLNTDANKISKEQLIAKLTAWCKSKGIPENEIMNQGNKFTSGWIKDAGDQVHFRMPIQGYDGYVQTDFMFTDDPTYQRGAKMGGSENYTGADRAVLLSSLARGRGYKMSPKFGLVDPNNGDAVVTKDWNEIAKILLGDPNAKAADTNTVERMIAVVKKDPNFEELIGPWKDSMEKQGKGVPTESLADRHLNRIKELLGNM